MSLTEYIKKKRFAPGPGVDEPPPDKGFKRFLFIFYHHFWRLITLNLLFLAFCIPVITIPAAICGANRVLIMLVREGNCSLWQDFIGEFKSSFFKSLPFGIPYIFLLLDSMYAFRISVIGDSVNVPAAALAFCLFGAATLFFGYAFVFIPALPLKNRHIAKNAFIFMLTEWKTNIIMLAVTLAMTAALVLTAIGSIMIALTLLVFIYFSLSQLMICAAVAQPMQKRIIEPYELNHKKES